jgi:beta-1,4-mannooligosaccharide/beta-1,4-mannosyl-N-acetylglucosamine phosphorylase
MTKEWWAEKRCPPYTCLYDQPTGRIAIYYGGADTVTALAFCKVDEVLNWIRENSMV